MSYELLERVIIAHATRGGNILRAESNVLEVDAPITGKHGRGDRADVQSAATFMGNM